MATWLVVKLAAIGFFVASAAYVHLRGRVRHSVRRQIGDHSTVFAPYNVFAYLFSAVPRTPLLDPRDFPALAPLRESWRTIRDEAVRLHRDGRIRPSDTYSDVAFNTFFRRGWGRFYLKWYDDVLPSAGLQCPETVRLVQSIPSVNAALFALLPPGAKLGAHRDPFAGSLRYHLGLVTPGSPACRIHVDGTPYFWRDGEDVVFDETYIHEAVNESDVDRIILFCDVTRPLRTRVMRALNAFAIRHVVRHTASRNEAGERLGVVNGIAGHAYHAREFFRRVRKRTGRRAYYGVKYGLLVLLLWMLFASWLP